MKQKREVRTCGDARSKIRDSRPVDRAGLFGLFDYRSAEKNGAREPRWERRIKNWERMKRERVEERKGRIGRRDEMSCRQPVENAISGRATHTDNTHGTGTRAAASSPANNE